MSDDDPRIASEPAGKPAGPAAGKAKPGLFGRLRTNFIAGVVVAAPIGITAWLIYWFVTGPMAEVDGFVRRALPSGDDRFSVILDAIPGVGVLVAFAAIVALGAFAKNFIGRAFIKAGQEILDAMPIVRSLHRFFKNVFETALQKSALSFKQVALVEYPSKGLWALAFVVGEGKGEFESALASEYPDPLNVFVPTVPNPTSGFCIFVSRSRAKLLKMSVEDAAKFVFSMGLVVPEFRNPDDAVRKLEEVAAAAREKRPFNLLLAGKGKASRNGSA